MATLRVPAPRPARSAAEHWGTVNSVLLCVDQRAAMLRSAPRHVRRRCSPIYSSKSVGLGPRTLKKSSCQLQVAGVLRASSDNRHVAATSSLSSVGQRSPPFAVGQLGASQRVLLSTGSGPSGQTATKAGGEAAAVHGGAQDGDGVESQTDPKVMRAPGGCEREHQPYLYHDAVSQQLVLMARVCAKSCVRSC